AIDRTTGSVVVPAGSVGFRWGDPGRWNLEPKDAGGRPVELELTLVGEGRHDAAVEVAFPYFGNLEHEHFASTDHASVLRRRVPAKAVALAEGEVMVATVFDLL